MKKSFTGLIVLGFIAFLLAVSVIVVNLTTKNLHVDFSDDDISKSGIVDEYGLFSSDQPLFDRLSDEVRECARKNRMNILVYLPDSRRRNYSDDDVRNFTDETFDATFGEFTDGILYYIDISGKRPACDDMSKSGSASIVYTDSICQSMFSSLDQYLPSSYSTEPIDPEKAISHFCSFLTSYNTDRPRMSYYYDGNAQTRSYTYKKNGKIFITESMPPVKKLKTVATSDLAGVLIALILYFVIKRNYKFKNKTDPRIYLADGVSSFTQVGDIFQ